MHQALPEIDLAEVNTASLLFGRSLRAPLLISCMTGGSPEAGAINRILAETAQTCGVALGLGSGRVLLESPEVLESFRVRHLAPDVPVLANLGAVQLNLGVGIEECRRLVSMLEADALVLHLNPLQESLQPGGDTRFRGLLERIGHLCAALDAPVVVKEVGWGLGPDTVAALLAAGVTTLDVAGAGGTSWSEVERYRLDDPVRTEVARSFAGWGIPTAEAVRLARQAAPEATIIASGGVQDGIDVATALALGADLVGLAGPFLRAAAAGEAHLLAETLIETLRIVMFCTGCGSIRQLQATDRLVSFSG